MATNPMQRKSRISFLLGMLAMLVLATIVIALLYMRMQNQQKELDTYKKSLTSVYVLSQDVKSGQIITSDMFNLLSVPISSVPSDATTDIVSMIETSKLVDTDGRTINAPNSTKSYYYYKFSGSENDYIIYSGNDVPVTTLTAGDKAYYYAGENNTQKTEIQVANVDAVVAKIDMKSNTIITRSAIGLSSEQTTKDLRKEEYNVISLPVDLQPEEYVDIRFMLPNGQNYVVISKKRVTIPMVDGAYSPDTIQMNLTEEETLILSAAIVENYNIDGSKLYASRYVEAGNQEKATITYIPNDDVWSLISTDKNIVKTAIAGIQENRQKVRNQINAAKSQYGTEENVKTKTEESITSTIEARQNYLQSLTGTVTQ